MYQAYVSDSMVRDLYHNMSPEERQNVLQIIHSDKEDAVKWYSVVDSNERICSTLKYLGMYKQNGSEWLLTKSSINFINTLFMAVQHNIAPSYGMRNGGSTCWFDSFVFMMLADPSNQFPMCLENKEKQLARKLLQVKRFMYHGGTDPNTCDIIKMIPSTKIHGLDVNVRCGSQDVAAHAALIIDKRLGCGITVSEFGIVEELDETRLLAVARGKAAGRIRDVPDIFVPYGQVFYFKKTNDSGHYTAMLKCFNGVLYYDDTATQKVMFFENESSCRRTIKNKITQTYDFYYRNSPVVVENIPAGETKCQTRRQQNIPGWVYSMHTGRPERRYMPGDDVDDGYVFGPNDTYAKLNMIFEYMGKSLEEIMSDVAETSFLDDEKTLKDAAVDAYEYIVDALEEHAEKPIDCIEDILKMTTKSRMLWESIKQYRMHQRRTESTGTTPGVYDGSRRYNHDSCPEFQHAVIYDMYANPVYVGSISHADPPNLDETRIYRIFHSQNMNSFERLQFVTQHAYADALPRIANLFQIEDSSAPPNTAYAKQFITVRAAHVWTCVI